MTTRRTFIIGMVTIGGALLSATDAFAAKSKKKAKRRRPGRRAAAPADPNDPVGKLTAVYNRALKDVDGRVVTLPLGKDFREQQFSASLVELWTQADAKPKISDEEGGAIDFDPVTNSQGLTVKSFTIATEKEDDSSAALAVTIKTEVPRESPAENIIKYDFVREGGRWKIDNISSVSEGKPWSLKGVLTRYLMKK
ncbi:MAG: DUF3828 domain-containing protein [Xanthobacteraceae bacterium]